LLRPASAAKVSLLSSLFLFSFPVLFFHFELMFLNSLLFAGS
jgi:hypothetical protein